MFIGAGSARPAWKCEAAGRSTPEASLSESAGGLHQTRGAPLARSFRWPLICGPCCDRDEEQGHDGDEEEHGAADAEGDLTAPRRGDRGRLGPQHHAQHVPRTHGHEQREDAREVAAAQDPALEPPARPDQEVRDDHDEDEAEHDPRQPRGRHRAAHADALHREVRAADPVDDAVGEVGARGVAVAVAGIERRVLGDHALDPTPDYAWGRKRPPHLPRTSASSAGVITLSPRERAYASTAFTTMPRANDGMAFRRSRAAGSHVSW